MALLCREESYKQHKRGINFFTAWLSVNHTYVSIYDTYILHAYLYIYTHMSKTLVLYTSLHMSV